MQWAIDLRTVNNELEILQSHLLDQIAHMKTALSAPGGALIYLRKIDSGYAAAIERLEKFVRHGDHPVEGSKPGKWISALDYVSKRNRAVDRKQSNLRNQFIDLDGLLTRQKTLMELLGHTID